MRFFKIIYLCLLASIVLHKNANAKETIEIDNNSPEAWMLTKIFPDAELLPCKNLKGISIQDCKKNKLLLAYYSWRFYTSVKTISFKEQMSILDISSFNEIDDIKTRNSALENDPIKDRLDFFAEWHKYFSYCISKDCKKVVRFKRHSYEDIINIWNGSMIFFRCPETIPEAKNQSYSNCAILSSLYKSGKYPRCSNIYFPPEIFSIDEEIGVSYITPTEVCSRSQTFVRSTK